jgi:steroid delta-isomerase-like uncharacterized protein
MSEDNKAIAARALDCFSTGDVDSLDELVAPDAEDHDTQNPHRGTRGPEGGKKVVEMYRAAFPDLKLTVEDQIAEGNLVCTRWVAVGTQDGDLPGLPATGKQSTVTGISIDRIEDGKVVETWTNWDTLGMMQQLGAIPEAAEATA